MIAYIQVYGCLYKYNLKLFRSTIYGDFDPWNTTEPVTFTNHIINSILIL